ncbi:hypothetical protein F5X99DRAFT_409955 [Biscogniauxia marginata]|nr:hypothetical protein F5X99DRAFT_409955 [Biscogniauxia marginata]
MRAVASSSSLLHLTHARIKTLVPEPQVHRCLACRTPVYIAMPLQQLEHKLTVPLRQPAVESYPFGVWRRRWRADGIVRKELVDDAARWQADHAIRLEQQNLFARRQALP